MTTTTTGGFRPPNASSRAWSDPFRWVPGDPIYWPYTENYGYSRSRPLIKIIDDHPSEECNSDPDNNDDCTFFAADAWRWYPTKVARHKTGEPEYGPYLREFHGARVRDRRP